MADTYALILAGGSGTRFWPLSRKARPKQLLQLFDRASLLENTVNRLEGLVPPERIFVLTNAEQEAGVRALLPDIPPDQIVAEPEKRDTAPAIALGIGCVAARDPAATMFVLPADHLIRDVGGFQQVLRAAAAAAERASALLTVGIRPSWPCPSYGYIERGRAAVITGYTGDLPVHEVVRFREKPNAELAEEFLRQSCFSWNAGMFIWSVPTVLHELSRHCPDLADFVNEIRKSRNLQATLRTQFGSLLKISIDYALMERASRVLNIEATFDWDDVGSWISVSRYLTEDENHNRIAAQITQIDASHNIVYSREPSHIALVGVDDLIVVQTADALLIAHRDAADDIRKLGDCLPPELL